MRTQKPPKWGDLDGKKKRVIYDIVEDMMDSSLGELLYYLLQIFSLCYDIATK